MAKTFFRCIIFIIFFACSNLLMAEDELPETVPEPDVGKATAGILIGATTINGENYQQIGIRADIPIWKIGLGIDAQFLFNSEGHLREEDWDEFEDYLDLIYYIRWAKKGDPFYVKVGGLDYSYIGYSNIINGYSNMVEYPDYKRLGMEMSFKTERFGGEVLINDYKELFDHKPGMLIGTRLTYRILGDFIIGGSIASDFNEYNGLRDTDDDDYPDEIDAFPENSQLVTERERLEGKGLAPETIADLIAHDELDPTTREDLIKYGKLRSNVTIYSLDCGYPIIEKEHLKIDLYSALTKIHSKGWGVSAPGFRILAGDYFTFMAEYRIQSEEFLFGYFNNTYELERAQFVIDGATNQLVVVTKKQKLDDIEKMRGYIAGISVNVENWIGGGIKYQDMHGDNTDLRSLNGDIIFNDGALPMWPSIKGYYAQNNVEDLEEWKTPSTICGFIVKQNLGGTALFVDTRYTFQDWNGDGKIKGDDETIKTLSMGATVSF